MNTVRASTVVKKLRASAHSRDVQPRGRGKRERDAIAMGDGNP